MRVLALVAALALFACAPATRSVSTGPAVAPITPTATGAAPRRHRHLARLTPPFATASGARRIADDTVATAFARTP